MLSDIGADAIKTGMLATAPRSSRRSSRQLRAHAPGVPLVVDPVMVAKGGAGAAEPRRSTALRDRLLPLAALITPNLPEAEALTGRRSARRPT